MPRRGVTLEWEIRRIGVPGGTAGGGGMTRVAVLYGGISAEREVSLSSGRQVIAALREAGFEVTPIEVGRRSARGASRRSTRSPTPCSTRCTAASARTARSRACSTGSAFPTRIPACAPRRWRWTRWRRKRCSPPPACRCRAAAWSTCTALEAADPLPRPYVVKPVNEGSSVGVAIMRDGDNRRAEHRARTGASAPRRWPRNTSPAAN